MVFQSHLYPCIIIVMYIVLLLPIIFCCFGVGIVASAAVFFLGAASLSLVAFLNAEESLLFTYGILIFCAIIIFLTKLKDDIDWKEVRVLGPSLFLSVGLTFYFSFKFYFRNPGLFLAISAVIGLTLLPFSLRSWSRKQDSLALDVIHGSLLGVVVGALGFAGLLILIPLLQVFRKIDQRKAISTCLPLSAITSLAFLIVLYTPKVGLPTLFTDASWGPAAYFLIGLPILAGVPLGIKFGQRLVNDFPPGLITAIQAFFCIVMATFGWIEARIVLPCLSQDPLSCTKCLSSEVIKQEWGSALTTEPTNSKSQLMTAVINSCGEPLALDSGSTKNILTLTLPDTGLTATIDRKTGSYSETYHGIQFIRIHKERVYFDGAKCFGKPALPRKKLETQIGSQSIFNSGMYRLITGTLPSFHYKSYQDSDGTCVNKSGILANSRGSSVYSLDLVSNRPDGLRGAISEKGQFGESECCFKLSVYDSFTSVLYYADDRCQSATKATDNAGPSQAERSMIFHQGKHYQVKSEMPEFEYRSFQVSGKDCVKQRGILSPRTTKDAYAVQEISPPRDFSKQIPLSFRAIRPYDLSFW